MAQVTLSLTAQRQREILYFLRRRYNKPRSKLKALIMIAVLKEVAAQADDDIKQLDT